MPDNTARLQVLKNAFGEEGKHLDGVLNDLAKVAYDAYRVKVEQSRPVYAKRSEIVKKIPGFWLNAMTNCDPIAQCIDAVDRPLFKDHLEDITINHSDTDVRDFDVVFTFSENTFFEEKTLVKSFTVQPPKSKPPKGQGPFEVPAPYDMDAQLYTKATPITWKSDEVNLCKKAPMPKLSEMEAYDEIDGFGSFFTWFEDASPIDPRGLGEQIDDWWPHAIEYSAGMAEGDDDGDDLDDEDDEDEESDDDEDPNREIDLESDDGRPKKKKRTA